jgi:UDPglucose 6-dehydrogenase
MKITIIGSGYVGLVSGACFAKIGHEVICIDNDKSKISKLQQNIIPIYEPGLEELISDLASKNKIRFSNDLASAVSDAQAIFIAVGTPQDQDGSADLSYVLNVVNNLANIIKTPKIIITKSTVPAGTGARIRKIIDQINPNNQISLASNPEFLREGFAIDDFLNPDRIIIGCEDEASKKILAKIYQPLANHKIIFSDIITAELIKYASNAFLATKISFINEMANLCEILDGDIKTLSQGIGLDSRIGQKFLNPGPGFGGSCFPKDIQAILKIAKDNNTDLSIINAAYNSNINRIDLMIKKIQEILSHNLSNKKIALLGLAFKANTDDIRYSPAINIAKKLLDLDAIINAHDPKAIYNTQIALKNYKNIKYYPDPYQAIKDCDAIIIATEWQEYQKLDLSKIRNLTKSKIIIDLRNIFNKADLIKYDFKYHSIG